MDFSLNKKGGGIESNNSSLEFTVKSFSAAAGTAGLGNIAGTR